MKTDYAQRLLSTARQMFGRIDGGDYEVFAKIADEIQRDAREGTVPVEDVRRAVQFADRYVAAEGDEYMKWLRAKQPKLFEI